MRTLCTIALALLTTLVYSQKSTLLKNINIDANELQHSLNKTGDSIILKGERLIDKVEIFNSDFQKTFIVQNNGIKIPLHEIPVGRFVTEVKLSNKLIIITLLRHEALNDTRNLALAETVKPKDIVKIEAINTIEKVAIETPIVLKVEESVAKIEIDNAALAKVETNNTSSATKNKPEKRKIRRAYWTIKMIVNGNSSRKVMKFANQAEVDKMIEQHAIDLESKAGKTNELTIWEVYDTIQFLRYKRKNPNYTETVVEADCYNASPYYKSLKKPKTL